jgi:hypothetical protein
MNASAALIRPQEGDMSLSQFKALEQALGRNMIFTHNPELGGAVVMPYGKGRRNMYQPELEQASTAAKTILGGEPSLTYGRSAPQYGARPSDYGRDRLYMGAPYGVEPNAETARIRELLKRAQAKLFDSQGNALPTTTSDEVRRLIDSTR